MQLPHTFFEDEVREGFYISGSMKCAWAAEMEVLEEIDKVCKKYDIRWFADCGTLLGAVRHGGFIPWDDDLDICMMRDDYVRFNEIAKLELPEGYEVLSMHSKEPIYEFLTHVTNGHEINLRQDHLKKYHNCPYALGVDIFPIDYLSADAEEEKQRKIIAKTLTEAAGTMPENLYAGDANLLKVLDDHPEAISADDMLSAEEAIAAQKEYIDTARELLVVCGKEINSVQPIKQQLYEAAEEAYMMFSSDQATEVALMFYWSVYDNHVYPRELFENVVDLPFESGKICAPAAYDEVLRIEYGDYMKVVRGGSKHDYPCFHKQEELLAESETYPFIYKFQPQDLEVHREPECAVKRESREFLELIGQAHRAIEVMLVNGQADMCRSLLVSCQESAIRIGTLIEQEYGEGYETVKPLEEYCELLYEITNLLQDSYTQEVVQVIAASLEECRGNMETAVTQGVLERKKVLFLPFRVCYWEMMEPLWKRYSEDLRYEVVVMPIPYYERDAKGAAGAMHFETAYPSYVKTISCLEYDIRRSHPDVIVIQNPYDGCNFTTSVPTGFYASNLKMWTEELIYIPYFLTDDFGAEDELANYTMRYFVKVPGVVQADRVVVPSENMRQRYVACLTELAGEETKSIWEEKVCADETWASEVLASRRKRRQQEIYDKLPDAWKRKIEKADGRWKKILLCSTEVSSLSQFGEAVLQKLTRAWKEIRAHADDLVLIWRPHPGIRSVFEESHPDLYRAFEAFRQRYLDADFGIYDDTDDLQTVVDLCDAYYGDPGSTARACAAQKKPVMLLDINI